MTLTLILVMAAASVAACLFTGARLVGWRFILRHATTVDVAFTVGAVFMLAGSITGMLIGILSGLMMAAFLTAARWVDRMRDYTPRFDERGRRLH